MSESRLNTFKNAISKSNLSNLNEIHSTKKIAQEIHNIYQSSDANEKKEMKKLLSHLPNELDDFCLLNITYQLLKIDINHFNPESGDDLYLYSSRSIASSLYSQCAIRFNYFLMQEKNQNPCEPMRLLNQVIWQYYNNNIKFPNQDINDKINLFFKDILYKLRQPIIETASSSHAQQLIYINQLTLLDKASIKSIIKNLPQEENELRNAIQYTTSLISLEENLKGKNSSSVVSQRLSATKSLNKLLNILPDLTQASMNDITSTSQTSSGTNIELSLDSNRSTKDLSDSDINLILKLIDEVKKKSTSSKQKKFLDEFYTTVKSDPTGKWMFELMKAEQLWRENEFSFGKLSNKDKHTLQDKMKKMGGAFGGLLSVTTTNKNKTQKEIILELLNNIYPILFSKYETNRAQAFHEVFKKIGLLNTTAVTQFNKNQSLAFVQLFQNVIPFATRRRLWDEKNIRSFNDKNEQLVLADSLYNDTPIEIAMIFHYMELHARLIVEKYFNVYKEYGALSKENITIYLDILRPSFMFLLDPLNNELEGNNKDQYIESCRKFTPKINPDKLSSSFLSEILLIAAHHVISPETTRLEKKSKLSADDNIKFDGYLDAKKNLVLMTRIGPEVELEGNNLCNFFENSNGETILNKMLEASQKTGSRITNKFLELNITNSSLRNSQNIETDKRADTPEPDLSKATEKTLATSDPSKSIEKNSNKQHASLLFHAKSNSSNTNPLVIESEYLNAWRTVVNNEYWHTISTSSGVTNSFLRKSTKFDLIASLKQALNENNSEAVQLGNLKIALNTGCAKLGNSKDNSFIKQLVNISNKEQLDQLVQEINDDNLTKSYFKKRMTEDTSLQ